MLQFFHVIKQTRHVWWGMREFEYHQGEGWSKNLSKFDLVINGRTKSLSFQTSINIHNSTIFQISAHIHTSTYFWVSNEST